ncbi:deoxyribose-phosphate aldolase [Polaribacter batillariae]|uniref:Deoxyribose-phosphate aldolase n=1 Tax=Polaribacter batillariae TaxID=2808900 RepID=A0ABX7SWJ5_9FLAO|nr:DUF6503 family protein [Polaribacter batillariae]QTD37838.1 deoxyribose-phosphate aldolase [Polaribacter batillariae]
MRFLFTTFLLLLVSCKSQQKKLNVQEIIDKTILYSGANKVANSNISFQFRDKKYNAVRKNGHFKLSRFFSLDNQQFTDELTNTGFKRFVNGTQILLADSVKNNLANSVNSVHYFSVLPYGLNDKAVNKKLLKSTSIKGKEYYKIEITFSKNGGGEDFEDVFIYWIGKDDFLIDYLAYAYHTNGGGKRFRVLKEQCVKNGIRFVDYYNYKPINTELKLINIDKAFEENQLIKVSEIVLKDIKVTLLE